MIGERKILEVGEEALRRSPPEETEIVILYEESALTRFADNTIHQDIVVWRSRCIVRAVWGKRVGFSSVTPFGVEELRRAMESATEIAKLQPADEDFPGLSEPSDYEEVEAFDEKTTLLEPVERASVVKETVSIARSGGAIASGFLATSLDEIAVLNRSGIRAYFQRTVAEFSLTVAKDGGSGYEQAISSEVDKIDSTVLAQRALQKALRAQNPVEIEPGEYTVVLEPYAVAELAEMLAQTGFGGREYVEGRSFLSDKLSERFFGENFSLYDNGLSREALPLPFDFEGVRRRPLKLVERGVVREVAFDTRTARRAGAESTGHALPQATNPYPIHLAVKAGDTSLSEIVASTGKGLYVSRFHYVNVVEPMSVGLTGMTRDGTFIIREGELAEAVTNLRFTESVLGAFSSISGSRVRLGFADSRR